MYEIKIIDYFLENWKSVLVGIAIPVIAGLILFFIKNFIKKRKGKRIGIKEEKNTIIKGKKAPNSEKAKLSNNKEQEYVIDTIRITNEGGEDIIWNESDCIIIESSDGFDFFDAIANSELGLMKLECNRIDNKKIRVSTNVLKTNDSICISIYAKHSENSNAKIPYKHLFDCLKITNFVSGVYVVKKRKSIAKFKDLFLAIIVFLLVCASGIHFLPKMNNYLDTPLVFQIESKHDSNFQNNDSSRLIQSKKNNDSIFFAEIRYDHELCPQLVIMPDHANRVLKDEISMGIDDFNENYNYRIINRENDNSMYVYRSSIVGRIVKLWMIIVAASLFLVYFTYKFFK